MRHDGPSFEPTFGFLSSLESPDYGHFGGYLIISPLGRPVEFHCTSPVKPSRAQEILYGPTLLPYLLGEQIAGALLPAAKLTPRLIVTNQPAMLAARPRAKTPMTLLLSQGNEPRRLQDGATEVPCAIASSGTMSALSAVDGRFGMGTYEFLMPAGFESEWREARDAAAMLSQQVDLFEPFGRIDEAIREAQRIGARAAENHGQAA
jgi:hypothetical protein